MIDIQKFNQALVAYKKHFDAWWWTDKNQNEKYKWQAVKHFQDNWDVDAEDFGQMFRVATAKHYNLLDVQNNFPSGMIIEFAKVDNEAARSMFSALFDEYESLQNRIATFKSTAEEFRKKHNPGTWNMHYQDEHAISVYLWFRYPEKYYIYKYKEFANVAKFLNADIVIKKGKGIDNVVAGFRLYDDICALLKKDEELMAMFKAKLDETTYNDEQLKTLTSDFGYYISRVMANNESKTKSTINTCWYVGASWDNVDQTERFIKEGIWQNGSDGKYSNIIKGIKAGDKIAIKAAYTQRNDLPFDAKNNTVSINKIKVTGTVVKNPLDGQTVEVKWDKPFDEPKLWYFYTFQKRIVKVERSDKDWMPGALLDFTFNDVPQDYEKFMSSPYWADKYGNDDDLFMKYEKYIKLLEASHNIVLTGAPGTGKTFMAKEIAKAMGAAYEMVQFHPSYDYTDFVEGLRPTQAKSFERTDGVFKAFCKKALRNLLDSQKSEEVIQQELSVQEKIEAFLDDAINNESKFRIVSGNEFSIVSYNENHIIISNDANEKVKEIVLSYSDLFTLLKEDVKLSAGKELKEYFGRKYRTQQDSYTFILYQQIQKQKTRKVAVQTVQRQNFIFIIDEINRGEISKIFGELFFSIDPGYRGEKGRVFTQYQNLVEDGDVFKGGFFVPENVYIIGTMNDIDRSVESMDFAIRRRFTWIEVSAEESAENMNLSPEKKERMARLNNVITEIEDLGEAYQLGAAYFLDNETTDEERWQYRINPLLKEYLRGTSNEKENLKKLQDAYEGEPTSDEDNG